MVCNIIRAVICVVFRVGRKDWKAAGKKAAETKTDDTRDAAEEPSAAAAAAGQWLLQVATPGGHSANRYSLY